MSVTVINTILLLGLWLDPNRKMTTTQVDPPTPPATPLPPPEGPTSPDINYIRLKEMVRKYQDKIMSISAVQLTAHCPFQLLLHNNVTHIVCDYEKLLTCSDRPRYDCDDALDYCVQVHTVKNTENGKKVYSEAGCVYYKGKLKGRDLYTDPEYDSLAGTVHELQRQIVMEDEVAADAFCPYKTMLYRNDTRVLCDFQALKDCKGRKPEDCQRGLIDCGQVYRGQRGIYLQKTGKTWRKVKPHKETSCVYYRGFQRRGQDVTPVTESVQD